MAAFKTEQKNQRSFQCHAPPPIMTAPYTSSPAYKQCFTTYFPIVWCKFRARDSLVTGAGCFPLHTLLAAHMASIIVTKVQFGEIFFGA